ncbi:MAG: zinc ABC transporter substrate-binding protein [Dysgonamonadaceae bacterium]|jgi:zinc transport system substrate-binding protein|nr:zinc ABC transporter substrate-binding protein [Dysgonamonadaceae bacterium]
MNRKIKIICLLAAALICACSKQSGSEKPLLMVTVEPQRFFAEQLAAPFFRVETMVPPGASPETYDPAPEKMAALTKANAYFAVGRLGFEQVWLNKMKQNCPKVKFFTTDEGVNLIFSEHSHGSGFHDGADPHVWSSPIQALTMVENMSRFLISVDEKNAETYRENAQKLTGKIKNLDAEIREILGRSNQKAFIIYHPALTYFARDYGLEQYCIESEGKEPSPAQIKSLIETAREKQIKTVFIQQEFDRKNAEAIARSAACKLVVINPLSYDWEAELLKIAKALSDE